MDRQGSGAPGAGAVAGRGLAAVSAWLVFSALVASYVYMAVRLPGGPDGMSDLAIYVGAAEALLAGGDLYAYAAPSGAGFTYPPFAAWVFAPLTLLDVTTQRVLWTVLSCGAVATLAWSVAVRSPVPLLARSPRVLTVPVLAVLLLLSYPVFSGLFLGQVSLLVIVLALLDALDLTPGRLRGVATGLAAAVKLTPLVFVLFLLLTGRRRAAGVAMLTFAVATAVGGLLTPGESRTYWTTNVAGHDFIALDQADNQSLVGWLARSGWTVDDGPTTVLVLVLAGAIGLVGYRRVQSLHRRGAVLAAAVVVGALTVVLSPISWSHHQTPLVLAAACLLAGGAGRLGAAWSAGVYLLLSIPAQALWLHRWPPDHPLTEAVLVLAVAVAALVPFRPASSGPSAPAGPPWRPGPRVRQHADRGRIRARVGP